MQPGREWQRCGQHCGHVVTGERTVKKSTGKPYFYYRCSVYNAPGHPRVRVSEKFLNQSFLSIFDRLKIEDGEQQAWLLRQVRRQTAQRVEGGTKRATEITRQLSLTIQRRNELLEMRLNGEVGAEIYAAKDGELREREDQLRAAFTSLAESRDVAGEPLTFNLTNCLRATWDTADRSTKRRIIRFISSDLQLNGELIPVLAKPFDVMGCTAENGVCDKPQDQGQDCPVPFGSPPWATSVEICDTIRAWQPSYKESLTPDDALGILLNVHALLDVLLPRTVPNRESCSEGTPK